MRRAETEEQLPAEIKAAKKRKVVASTTNVAWVLSPDKILDSMVFFFRARATWTEGDVGR